MRRPIAISMGDLGGIGPEVALKALQRVRLSRPVVLFGDRNAVAAAAETAGFKRKIREGLPSQTERSGIYLLSLSKLSPRHFRPGRPSKDAAKSTLEHLTAAIDATRSGAAAAIVTAPIHKENLTAIQFPYPGHTEYLAARTNTKRYAMMLAGDELKVTLVTIHCALKNVSDRLSTRGIGEKIALTHVALTDWFGIKRPRIGVLGLNPHAGEEGLFGDEEKRFIAPAIRSARKKGWNVAGPFPADGFFGGGRLIDGKPADAVICMYHDQGLIPLKMVHFWDGVNLTLGLPFVRTSPDHGTAYDIAGKGIADPRSMAQAIRWADRFSP